MTCLEAALAYAGRGWPVFPLWGVLPGGRCACGRERCDRPGKHPIAGAVAEGWKDASTDPERIRAWWRAYPQANVGLVTGAASGLLVVDVDGPAGLAAAGERGGYPVAPTVRTGRGRHIYLRLPPGDIRNRAGFLAATDLRATGGYVVAPPSVHASGAVYAWEITPDQAPLPAAPGWLLPLITRPDRAAAGREVGPQPAGPPAEGPAAGGTLPAGERQQRYAEAALEHELARLAQALPGTRNDALNRAAYSLGRLIPFLGRWPIEDALTEVAQRIGLEEPEIARTIKSGLDAGRANARPLPEGGQREGGTGRRGGAPRRGEAARRGAGSAGGAARRTTTGTGTTGPAGTPALPGAGGGQADGRPAGEGSTDRPDSLPRLSGGLRPPSSVTAGKGPRRGAGPAGSAARRAGTGTTRTGPAGTPALPGADEDPILAELLAASADDEGNARCVVAAHPGEFLFVEALGWLHWTGTHYRGKDAEAALDRAIVATLIRRQRAGLDARRDDIVRRCGSSARHVKDAKCLLSSLVTAGVDEFDRDPDLLNCLNGVVHLPTGGVIPHDTRQRFTYCVPVPYRPEADRGAWLDFLASCVDGGPELLAYLRQAVGYSLTGHTSEECLFYIYGPTRAGKGTFQETLTSLLPRPLAFQVDFATFTARRDGDANNFDLAPLKPARLVFAGESNKHQTLNPGKIKQLTGGDDVFCANKYHPHFNYRPQYKIWLVSNHPVNADVDDDALWARVRVIEFPHSVAGREDKTLKRRLRAPENLAGVLAWALEGARAWYQGGCDLKAPPEVEAATQKQREALDYVSMWLEECTTTHRQDDGSADPALYTTNERLYASYEAWCRENGVEPKKQRGLSEALKGKGYRVGVSKRVPHGPGTKIARSVEGLTLNRPSGVTQ